MKPTTQTSRQSDRLDQERSWSRRGSNQPLIACNFRPTETVERQFGVAESQQKEAPPVSAPGFRALSNEFFSREAKQHYVMELLLFVIIIAISAWPIAWMIQTLALTAE